MKLIYIFIFVLIYFYSSVIIAQNIAVINIQFLIDENDAYIEKINEIEINQQKFLKNFKNRENELKQMLDQIEESKLILSDIEINAQIDNYNDQLNNFSIIVDEFNLHYQNEILFLRETILREIIVLLEKYAIKNNIDLILDSTSYLIASNSIDITNNIDKELNKINIKLEYKDFENN